MRHRSFSVFLLLALTTSSLALSLRKANILTQPIAQIGDLTNTIVSPDNRGLKTNGLLNQVPLMPGFDDRSTSFYDDSDDKIFSTLSQDKTGGKIGDALNKVFETIDKSLEKSIGKIGDCVVPEPCLPEHDPECSKPCYPQPECSEPCYSHPDCSEPCYPDPECSKPCYPDYECSKSCYYDQECSQKYCKKSERCGPPQMELRSISASKLVSAMMAQAQAQTQTRTRTQIAAHLPLLNLNPASPRTVIQRKTRKSATKKTANQKNANQSANQKNVSQIVSLNANLLSVSQIVSLNANLLSVSQTVTL